MDPAARININDMDNRTGVTPQQPFPNGQLDWPYVFLKNVERCLY